MSVSGIAALIGAVSFAVLAVAASYTAIRLTRLLADASALVRESRAGQEELLGRANATVDRATDLLDKTTRQLNSTEAVSASMEELGAGVSELAGQVSALAGLSRTMAGTLIGGPAGKAAAVVYGVRHAIGLRRGGKRRPLVVPGDRIEVVDGAELDRRTARR